jgi:hypothetical protein
MSADSFSQVTSESWFTRIKNAFVGILVGLVLFFVAFPVLFWNEGRSVKTYKTLKEGGGAVVSVASDNVDPANESKLVHVTAKADTGAPLSDPVFGVTVQALKLKRVVELYQWKETADKKTEKKLGGGTETVTAYSYSKEWSGDLISSSNFKKADEHKNPTAMPYPALVEVAQDVTVGAFVLSPSLVSKINHYEAFAIGRDKPIPEALKEKVKHCEAGYYVGADPATPQIGDARITFKVANPAEISVIAKQTGKSFAPYGTKAGGTIELLQTGVHDAAEMIQKAQSDNTMMTWILRLVGFILMLVGMGLILRPLAVVADVIPFVGSIMSAGIGLISFLVATSFSLATIAVAWIVYRPLLGGLLIAGAVALIVVIKGKLSSNNPTA